jgi:hypothetical protein
MLRFLARDPRSGLVAVLAPAYRPRRPTETVLYSLVREHLESFVAYARDNYDGGLPRYVEDELRGYLKCGVFSEGFVRAHCDVCGHDLLIAFSCKSRTTCPSCAGSLNLHVHFHVAVLDGVFTRGAEAGVVFHPAPPPTHDELGGILRRVQTRAQAWLRRHGHLDERPLEDRPNEAPAQTALDACASIAMARGQMTTLPNADEPEDDHASMPGNTSAAVDHDGFNLHAGVRLEAGDDAGREKLVRYGARPALSLQRLRRLPGGRVAYRLKYVGRGRGKYRVMTAMEFMARLAALIPPPRYPLVRYAGVLGPRSSWRKQVVPRPRGLPRGCDGAAGGRGQAAATSSAAQKSDAGASTDPRARPPSTTRADATDRAHMPPRSGRPPREDERVPPLAKGSSVLAPVTILAPPIVSVHHWDRLLGGLLYAMNARIDWATLLRRSMDVDALQCPKCDGRLRVLAVITEREPVQRILSHLGMPTGPPPIARERDPSDDADDEPAQLELALL